jgi:hypothetical protein
MEGCGRRSRKAIALRRVVEQGLNGARVAQMFLDHLAAYADVRCRIDLPPERPRDS